MCKLKKRPGDPVILQRIKSISHSVTKRKNELRKLFVRKKFFDRATDSRKCWEALNSVLGRKKRFNGPEKLTTDDGLILDTDTDTEVAEELNRFFCFTGATHAAMSWFFTTTTKSALEP